MFLRIYRPEDKRSLQQLFFDSVHQVMVRDYTPAQLVAWAPTDPDRQQWSRLDGQFSFVVEGQKMPVGFVSLQSAGILDYLYVHPDFQGRGVATALYKQVERVARKHQFATLQVITSRTAFGFFEKKGFLLLAESSQTLRSVDFQHYKMEKLLQPRLAGLSAEMIRIRSV